MNNITLIGNLTKKPDLQTTPSGKSVCKFAVAVNRDFKNADGNYDTDFFNITVWDKQGENAAKYLDKGKKVCVMGNLQFRKYTDKDGVERQTHDVMANKVEYLSPASNEQDGANAGVKQPQKNGSAAMTPVSDDDLPF